MESMKNIESIESSKEHVSNKVPLRYHILQLISHFGPLHGDEIMEKAKLAYGKEKQCQEKIINGHLESLRASGLLSEENSLYSITPSGSNRIQ